MLGMLAGNVCVASSSLRRDLRKVQHDGRSSGYCQRGTKGDRGDPPGGAIDRHELITTAKIESNFQPLRADFTSSAKGLYQFIDQTELGTMKQDGAALWLGRYANAIERQRDGRYVVSVSSMRTEILRLRSDWQASAMLASNKKCR